MGVVQELTWESYLGNREFKLVHSPINDGIFNGHHFAPGPIPQLFP